MFCASRPGIVLMAAALLSAPPAVAQDLRFGGFVQLDRRMSLTDSMQLADFHNVFRPELQASIAGRAELTMSLDLRFYDFSAVGSTDELQSQKRHFPNSLTAWEAFVRVSEFLLEPIDLTVGKQRIHWGTADGLNPTDRFNAYDLSDVTDFTARIPVWAVRAEYYPHPGWRIEGVWTPTAHGPILPAGLHGAFGSNGPFTRPGTVTSWDTHFEPPSRLPTNSQYGFRLSGQTVGMDLSASYFHGFDGIPVLHALDFVLIDTAASVRIFDGRARSRLPRTQVVGADLATDWHGIGLWAEGAMVFPEGVVTVTHVIDGSDTVRTEAVAIDGTPYVTWIVGGDYTFRAGWYLNLQWAHGLFLQRGAGELHDYMIGKLERRLLRETVTVSLQGILEVAQWWEWSGHVGYGVYPGVAYTPIDNLSFSVGALFAGGGEDVLFGQLDDVDQLYLRVKANF